MLKTQPFTAQVCSQPQLPCPRIHQAGFLYNSRQGNQTPETQVKTLHPEL